MPPTADTTQELKEEHSNKQRAILPKKCLYCERRFSKAEHLKRHQRSHTGERPYRCSRCQKCFSRSDVLIRHLKNHPQIPGEVGEQSSSDGEPGPVNVKRRASASSALGGPQMNSSVGQSIQDHSSRALSPSRIDPALLGPAGDYHDQTSAHAMASGLDHLALLASQQAWGSGSGEATMTDSHSGVIGAPSEAHGWGQEVSSHGHEFGSVLNYQHGLTPSDSEFQMIAPANGHHAIDFANDIYSGRHGSLQDQISPVMGGVTPNSSMMPTELMNWFDQFDMDTNGTSDGLQNSGITPGSASQLGRHQSALSPDEGNSSKSPGSGSVVTLIPAERFHKVERCWPTRPSNTIRLMPTLWHDAVSKAEDNLFSRDNLSPEAIEHNRQFGSRWGLDEDCRVRLQKMFVNLSRKESRRDSEGYSPFSHSSPSAKSSITNNIQEEMSNIPNFPPAEIFDISLDLFFRQFHPLMQFIHTPTFCPKTAPTSILLIMCLIGLTILQTKGATAFVRQAFPKALEKVCTELMGPSREGGRIDQLSSMASAILILCLSEMTGDRSHQEQCQMLYTNVITTAQRHGLFNAAESHPLDDHLFTSIPDLDARWKAWARVECVKRLISCLTMVDTWYSAMFHTSPVMRTDDIRIVLPCESALFQAQTATKWQQLLARGSRMCMPAFTMTSEKLSLPRVDGTIDVNAMNGILCTVRLRISESFHRLLSGTQRRAVEDSFIPWKTYEPDNQAKASQRFTTEIVQSYGPMLSNMNSNCMILWHNMCIMITTDLRLFELGAGCSGPEAAREALDDIAIWTQTAAARRACIHAAQTFMLTSNRRASDGEPFHATTGLFISALVLGLYVFMAPSDVLGKDSTGPVYDLVEEVDWNEVGGEGLTDEVQRGESAANNFIRHGGQICFDGVIHHPGFESARRILLDYARLLEDMSKWRAGVSQYSRVLRIMSDALVDVEASGE